VEHHTATVLRHTGVRFSDRLTYSCDNQRLLDLAQEAAETPGRIPKTTNDTGAKTYATGHASVVGVHPPVLLADSSGRRRPPG
jgi:hypothetical protein